MGDKRIERDYIQMKERARKARRDIYKIKEHEIDVLSEPIHLPDKASDIDADEESGRVNAADLETNISTDIILGEDLDCPNLFERE